MQKQPLWQHISLLTFIIYIFFLTINNVGHVSVPGPGHVTAPGCISRDGISDCFSINSGRMGCKFRYTVECEPKGVDVDKVVLNSDMDK